MILDKIAAHARARVEAYRRQVPDAQMLRMARALPRGDFPFEKALAQPGLSFICELKRASPSKGVISEEFPYIELADAYAQGGAAALSVLTEPKWFLGSDEILQTVVAFSGGLPVLRKDFTVDPYMVAQAKVLGASAVLLITSLLDDGALRACLSLADELGLSALVEAHTEAQIRRALACGARVIGVNNRNLADFTVDHGLAARLRRLVPPGVLFVSESGVRGARDVWDARRAGCDGVLVGETLMRAADPRALLEDLRRFGGAQARGPYVKICGLTREQDVRAVNGCKPDFVGFVFAPDSPRQISYEKAAKLRRLLDPAIRAVGVFVDANPSDVMWLMENGIVQYAQLHGAEPDSDIRRMQDAGFHVLRAGRVRAPGDAAALRDCPADMLVLDAGAGGGRAFPWALARELERPYLLAGGLSPENVAQAVRELHPWGVDVSSGVETNGKKDPAKIEKFIQEVRNAD